MRARRREINIFNMSLLDILCGALGAFCFMMIVALPYYKPPGKNPELKKAREETDRLMNQLDQMKNQMRDAQSTEDMSALLARLKAQVQALQGQVNILSSEKDDLDRRVAHLTAENQTLRTTNQGLAETNQNLQAQLRAKKPFTIVARADDYSQGLDLVLFKPTALAKNSGPFLSWTKGAFDDMHTVRSGLLFNHGIGLMVNENSPPNSEGKIFLRLTNRPGLRKKTTIESAIVGDEKISPPIRLPAVTLYPERYWVLLGTLAFDQASQPHFTEATAAEREAAWQKLTGSTPPPAPTPPPTPTNEERAAKQAKYQQQRTTYQKFSTLMRTPLDPSGKNDAEILRLCDELLKELPPNDRLRREVQSRRELVMEAKARRERQTAPNESASPTPPIKP